MRPSEQTTGQDSPVGHVGPRRGLVLTCCAPYSKLHELEAELCKVKSKYVILLKETQEPELGGCGISHQGCVI